MLRLAPALGFTTFPVQRWTRWRFHAPVCWRPQHESRFRVPRLAEDITLRRSFPLNLGPRGPRPPRGIPRALRPASSGASPCGGVGGSQSGPFSWCSMPFEALFLVSSRPGVLGAAVAASYLAAARPPGFCPPAIPLCPHRVIACCDLASSSACTLYRSTACFGLLGRRGLATALTRCHRDGRLATSRDALLLHPCRDGPPLSVRRSWTRGHRLRGSVGALPDWALFRGSRLATALPSPPLAGGRLLVRPLPGSSRRSVWLQGLAPLSSRWLRRVVADAPKLHASLGFPFFAPFAFPGATPGRCCVRFGSGGPPALAGGVDVKDRSGWLPFRATSRSVAGVPGCRAPVVCTTRAKAWHA